MAVKTKNSTKKSSAVRSQAAANGKKATAKVRVISSKLAYKGKVFSVYTDKELEDIRKRDRKPVNHIFRLPYVGAADASILIKPMLSSTGVIAITPAAGLVSTHAHTIRPARPHRTADSRFVAPTPTIAPVIVCVVLTGMPQCVAS